MNGQFPVVTTAALQLFTEKVAQMLQRMSSHSVDEERIDSIVAMKRHAFEQAKNDHLGYPYNLDFPSDIGEPFGGFLVNNLGDPYAGSHYATHCCDLERSVVSWFMDLWECDDHAMYWGSVGASGTEGNLWAIYLGREQQPDSILIHSEDAHYSIPKAAKILRIEAVSIASKPNGELSLEALQEAAHVYRDRPIILALSCGTTVKGAHDQIDGAIGILDSTGHGESRRYVHVDGALNAMVLPFLDGVAPDIKPSFRKAIDSISASGHKMVGTPMPCGVLVARRRSVDRVSSAISYLRSNDTTLMGSRNGHAVLALWSRIQRHGKAGFRKDVSACLQRARNLSDRLEAEGVPVLLNPHSLTIVFPEPAAEIVNRFQLACQGGLAHAIVMPNVTDALIARFLDAYMLWWAGRIGKFLSSSGELRSA